MKNRLNYVYKTNGIIYTYKGNIEIYERILSKIFFKQYPHLNKEEDYYNIDNYEYWNYDAWELSTEDVDMAIEDFNREENLKELLNG